MKAKDHEVGKYKRREEKGRRKLVRKKEKKGKLSEEEISK